MTLETKDYLDDEISIFFKCMVAFFRISASELSDEDRCRENFEGHDYI